MKDYDNNPSPKFYNKNYYNQDYMYHTEGPEVLRMYSERDNTSHPDFTDVLDSVYNEVMHRLSSGLTLTFSTPSSTAPSCTLLNLSGPSITPTRKGQSHQNSEESMPSEDTQQEKKGKSCGR